MAILIHSGFIIAVHMFVILHWRAIKNYKVLRSQTGKPENIYINKIMSDFLPSLLLTLGIIMAPI
jgi:hypothetical protein